MIDFIGVIRFLSAWLELSFHDFICVFFSFFDCFYEGWLRVVGRPTG